jgi:hypothetical protein
MAHNNSTSATAFELRLKLLETLVTGSSPASIPLKDRETVWRRASDVVKRLDDALEGNGGDSIKRFIEACMKTL